MVLEEATLSQEPSSASFSESLPSNDVDRYSGDHNPTVLSSRDPSYIRVSPQNTSDPVYINLNSMPKRWGLFGPKNHPPQLVNAIVDSCRMASQMLGRPVKQDEAEALAYHFARGVRIGSYGTPIGVSLAMVNAYRTMSTYRFPGWTPGEKWRAKGYPDIFGPLKGQRARMMWQITRFNVYGFLGAVLGQIFFGSYALTVGSAGRMMDPRLKELSEKIRDRVKNGQGGELLPGKREVDVTAGPREGETFDMARQRQKAQEGWKRSGQQPQPKDNIDDMSPTGGSFGEQYAEAGNQGDTGMMSDEQVASSNYQRQAADDRRYESQQSAASRAPLQRQRSAGAPYTSQPESAAKQSGSAWERLRQQATGTQSQQPIRTPQASARDRQMSAGGDSFTFSQVEEDRQLARSEEQKEFDARIEREREGKDFDDRGAGKGGWKR